MFVEKSKMQAAPRRISETQEVRKDPLVYDRVQTNAAACRSFRGRARYIHKKSYSKKSLSTITAFKSYMLLLHKKESRNYRAYLKYKKQLKAARTNAAAHRIKTSTDEEPSLCLGQSQLQTATIRSCESEEGIATRLCRQQMHVKEVYIQPKLQEDIVDAITNETQIKSKSAVKGMQNPLLFWKSQQKVINQFRPRFRAGLCPKSAGNCNLM